MRHGHVTVNGKRVTIPSYTLRKGDAILQTPGIKHREISCSDDYEVLAAVLSSFPLAATDVLHLVPDAKSDMALPALPTSAGPRVSPSPSLWQ